MKVSGIAAALSWVAFAACARGVNTSPDQTLTVHGSARAAAPALAPLQTNRVAQSAMVATGDPASLRVKMYALYIGPYADCSGMELVQDYGDAADYRDLVQNPLLFSAAAGEDTYNCVAMRLSDVIRFTPATTFSSCVAGTEYARDIYREGESDWKDVGLNTVVGSGTLDEPVEDHATVFMTTDTSAAIALGFSSHQVVPLGGSLIAPAATTFHWNGEGSVVDESGRCSIEPGQPSFE